MNEAIKRLQYVRRSLQAARDTQHGPLALKLHVDGINDGLDIAIRAIDTEIRMIESWTPDREIK